ncbi:HTH-type transcriptional regulator YjdC [compost metagenome]
MGASCRRWGSTGDINYRLTKKNDRSTVCNMNEITSNDTRDIILDVTEKLIYKSGIAATGMDLLVKTAGVSRKSIYRYFANKDELVVAALQRRDQRWMHWYRGAVGQAQTPAERLLNLFTVLKSWFASDGFRGCAFINTSGETGDPQDPVRLLAKEHKQKLLDYVCELCTEHGAEDPQLLARQLLILIDGAITVALVMGDHSAADNAQCMARKLLDL